MAETFSSSPFARSVLIRIAQEKLGVENVLKRPAEYYVQKADTGPAAEEGMMGVEIRITGVSRQGRTAHQIHEAQKELVAVGADFLRKCIPKDKGCQLFCVIMLDGEVETTPGSGHYSSNQESASVWVVNT